MIGRLISRTEITSSQEDEMLRLMQTHFCGVTRQQFCQDLDEKNWVILITDDTGRLRGFSTMLFYTAHWGGRWVHVIYSGDTIVEAPARSDPALPRTWIDAVNRLRKQSDAETVFWLLLTSGFRTYRFLPVFWRTFWPRYDRPTPPDMEQFLVSLAAERFGSMFDQHSGIVRFKHPQRLCPELLQIPAGRLTDPHVAFFLHRNPGFPMGDELLCLCELCEENLTSAGRRMVERTSLRNAPQGVLL